MKRIWHYANNQFLVVTRNNYKKALKLSREHDRRLKKAMETYPLDTDYADAYNRYHPLHLALEAAYTAWKNQGGMQKGDTLNIDQLLALLPGKVNKYDRKILDVHDKGTPRYTQLFPNDHKPFYTGTQESKIKAVEVIIAAIGAEAALAAVKLLFQQTLDELKSAKDEQSGAKGIKTIDSSDLDKSSHQAMVGQYQNVGFFINKFPEDPEKIIAMFDVETITNPEQTIWVGHLDPKEVHPALIHTFENGDMMRLKSNGKGAISAFLSSTPGGTDSAEIMVEPEHELIFDVIRFEVKDYAVNRYLTIINRSDSMETRFVIELY